MTQDPIPSMISTSSSSHKKKKSKKEKKRKRGDVEETVSLSPGHVEIGGEGGGKKKKKKKKEKKQQRERERRSAENESIERSGPSNADPPPSVLSLVAESTSPEDSTNDDSPYRTKAVLGTVALLPRSLPDVVERIRSLLRSLLLAYDAGMGGVLLSLDEGSVKLLPVAEPSSVDVDDGGNGPSSSSAIGGRVVDDLPHVHYRFRARALLFCPAEGMRLEGRVAECAPTFVILTTHHMLSTKISTEKLHERGYVYDSKSLAWTRERRADDAIGETDDEEGAGEGGVVLGPSTSIYLDDKVEFFVERIHECGGYISLDGTRPRRL